MLYYYWFGLHSWILRETTLFPYCWAGLPEMVKNLWT